MRPEERSYLIQKRAYEIYRQRDPHHGTARDDWQKAESEVEREKEFTSRPQQHKERTHWKELMSHPEPDVENPINETTARGGSLSLGWIEIPGERI
jgi:hypothetical protein